MKIFILENLFFVNYILRVTATLTNNHSNETKEQSQILTLLTTIAIILLIVIVMYFYVLCGAVKQRERLTLLFICFVLTDFLTAVTVVTIMKRITVKTRE